MNNDSPKLSLTKNEPNEISQTRVTQILHLGHCPVHTVWFESALVFLLGNSPPLYNGSNRHVKCNMPILLSKYSGINLFCIFHSTPHHLQPSTFSCCQSKCADRYLLPFTEAPFSPSCMHSRLSHSFSLSPPSLSHKHNLNNCADYRLLSYNKFQIILTHTNAYRQVC